MLELLEESGCPATVVKGKYTQAMVRETCCGFLLYAGQVSVWHDSTLLIAGGLVGSDKGVLESIAASEDCEDHLHGELLALSRC